MVANNMLAIMLAVALISTSAFAAPLSTVHRREATADALADLLSELIAQEVTAQLANIANVTSIQNLMAKDSALEQADMSLEAAIEDETQRALAAEAELRNQASNELNCMRGASEYLPEPFCNCEPDYSGQLCDTWVGGVLTTLTDVDNAIIAMAGMPKIGALSVPPHLATPELRAALGEMPRSIVNLTMDCSAFPECASQMDLSWNVPHEFAGWSITGSLWLDGTAFTGLSTMTLDSLQRVAVLNALQPLDLNLNAANSLHTIYLSNTTLMSFMAPSHGVQSMSSLILEHLPGLMEITGLSDVSELAQLQLIDLPDLTFFSAMPSLSTVSSSLVLNDLPFLGGMYAHPSTIAQLDIANCHALSDMAIDAQFFAGQATVTLGDICWTGSELQRTPDYNLDRLLTQEQLIRNTFPQPASIQACNCSGTDFGQPLCNEYQLDLVCSSPADHATLVQLAPHIQSFVGTARLHFAEGCEADFSLLSTFSSLRVLGTLEIDGPQAFDETELNNFLHPIQAIHSLILRNVDYSLLNFPNLNALLNIEIVNATHLVHLEMPNLFQAYSSYDQMLQEAVVSAFKVTDAPNFLGLLGPMVPPFVYDQLWLTNTDAFDNLLQFNISYTYDIRFDNTGLVDLVGVRAILPPSTLVVKNNALLTDWNGYYPVLNGSAYIDIDNNAAPSPI
ncbi:uncharacterized protein MONBRDRAFT_27595 [Monosiga brevicollis MX1]|uniref:EGF-like domain-containing protein n=1 Tax=Monosiga brevicollis TaxID=81824 RepID=A9V5R4_MONBE|nr:uncharacterized protein MONBRDRAFT_27595 [Monosiga brevicollis MX1]EDQ87087.1 predicted protein [Monosiga brevicollis MX1]|eukprot:XP_001748030.1 hypothetical protein [Monosiga brevicollis MX1]